MENGEQVIHLNINTKEMASAIGQVTQWKEAAGNLQKELLVLRLNLGKLKAAIENAFAPVGAVFVPMVNQAVWGATRLVKSVGKVIAALFGYEQAAKSTQKAQEKLVSTGEKLNRSVMDFDEINRLDRTSGSGGTVDGETVTEWVSGTLSPQLQAVVDKILSLTAPLKQIDFSPAVEAFGRLKTAVGAIGHTVFAGLEWAWHNLLVPLAGWTIEEFLPAFLDALHAGLGALNAVVTAFQPLAVWLWEEFLQPLAQWSGEKIIGALGWLREKLDAISAWISGNQELVRAIGIAAVGAAAAIGLVNSAIGSFNGLGGRATGLLGGFGGALGALSGPMELVSIGVKALGAAVLLLAGSWQEVKNTALAAWTAIRSVWSTAASWVQQNLLVPISTGFKGMVNGIIGFLNSMIAGIVSAVNSIVGAMNRIQWNVPEWVPGIGGQRIGLHLNPISTPRIPYLAQGAVLPANKPFMAVVGDQRHGTNIEAPLATIQQAVATVMEDMIASNLAGQEAIVAVLRQILEAVLGISIGEDVIADAVLRYQGKMAVVNGGTV